MARDCPIGNIGMRILEFSPFDTIPISSGSLRDSGLGWRRGSIRVRFPADFFVHGLFRASEIQAAPDTDLFDYLRPWGRVGV